MTEEEAIALYRLGEKVTVQKLLELDQEIEALKKALQAQHPHQDPSTPSGMKPPYEKPSAKVRKKRPGRKQGHQGVRRAAPKGDYQTQVHTLSHCPQCHHPLGKPCSTRERFIEDIPEVKPTVTKHVIEIFYCCTCQKTVEAPVEEALPKSTLGIRLLIHTAYLHFHLGLPLMQIVAYLNSCLHFPVSPGGLVLAWQRLAHILLPWYQSLELLIRTCSLLHIDETGWRVLGKAYWLWCFTSEKSKVAYYLISPSRASPVLKAVLGEFFQGVLVCDFFGAYNKIGAFLKQRCLLHLLRDMIRTTVFHRIPEWMDFTKKLKRIVKDALRLSIQPLSPEVYTRRCTLIEQRLEELINQPYKDCHCKRLVKRLKRHQHELFTFLRHPGVPADNNHAERMIRPAVIARKNSYCNRSEKGATTQAILMSIFRTLHLRQQDAIVTIEKALKDYCKTATLPTLFEKCEAQLSIAA
jgi:transposase